MELTATKREVFGKKTKALRREGITPANLFGHGIEPVALQCDTVQLRKVLLGTGTTGIIQLKLDKAKQPRNVMTREVQRNARTGEVLHVDFYQVRMEEKLKVEVPITHNGEAPALKHKENFLTTELDTLTIECLPNEIPNHIEIDLSPLEEPDDAIHVSDISLGGNIVILTHPEQIIVKISTGYIEEEAPVVEAEEGAEAAEEAAEAAEEASATEESAED